MKTAIQIEPFSLRAGHRYPMLVETCVRVGEQVQAFAVYDLSTTGFRGECEGVLRLAESVELELPVLGFIEAQIRWALNNEVGAQFRKVLSTVECQRAFPALSFRDQRREHIKRGSETTGDTDLSGSIRFLHRHYDQSQPMCEHQAT